MKRTPYRAGLVGDGLTDEQTTTYAMNSAIRTTEVLVRALAQRQGTVYRGGRPERQGDVYTRVWTGDNGHTVTAQAHPWRVAPAHQDTKPVDPAALDLFRGCKELEDEAGGWNGGDVVELVCEWLTGHGIDPDRGAEHYRAAEPAGTVDAQQLQRVAAEAYGFACAASDDYTRGYAAGVEDLARKLSESDPAASDRLGEILAAAGVKAGMPTGSPVRG